MEYTLETWLRGNAEHGDVPDIEPILDALRVEDVLLESWLIDVRVTPLFNCAVLVFDTRGALQLDVGLVAVVVVDDIVEFQWSTEGVAAGRRRAWTVLESRCEWSDKGLVFTLGFYPDAELTVVGGHLTFLAGDMPGVEGAPSDFGEAANDELWAGEPTWDRVFTPLAGSRRDAALQTM